MEHGWNNSSHGEDPTASVMGDNQTVYPPSLLFLTAGVLAVLAVVGAIGNAICCLLFCKLRPLHDLPMQPLVQASCMSQFLQCLFHLTHAVFIVMKNTAGLNGLCKIVYCVFSFTFVTFYWTAFAMSVMRLSHTLGFSCYFQYKKQFVVALCILTVIAGCIAITTGMVNLSHQIGYDDKFLLCFWNTDLVRHPLFVIDAALVGIPIISALLIDLLLLIAPGRFPLPNAQAQVFTSVNFSIAFALLSQTPFFVLLALGDPPFVPVVIYPIATILGSLTGFLHAVSFIVFNPIIRSICRLAFRGASWAHIQSTLENKPKRRYVRRRSAQKKNGEEYRFIEEPLRK